MDSRLSLPTRIALKAVLNVLLVFAMDRLLPDYFAVFGGWPAYVVVGSLITLLNVIVRPVLKLITLPLRLFATILSLIIVNGIFVWLIYRITLNMDPDLIIVVIKGGLGGWMIVSIVLGLGNWLMKVALK